MRKKIYILALALICIFSLAACGSDEEKDAATVDIEAVIAEIDGAVSAAELTDEELSQVEDLKAEMKEKVEAAETEEEKQDIVDEYKAKIEEITSGKMNTETAIDAEEENKDSDSSSQSSDSGDKSSSSSSGSSSTTSSGNSSSSVSSSSSSSSANSESSSGASGSSSSSKPSSGSSGSSSSQQTKPAKDESKEPERVWVEEKGHWEKEPVYEYGYDGYWMKDNQGNVFFKTKSWSEMEAKMDYYAEIGYADWTWGHGLPDEIIGYRDVWVVDEEGHYEYR